MGQEILKLNNVLDYFLNEIQLIDFIAKVKDERSLKGEAAAANNFRPCEKVGGKACSM
jgi:hypothetical protein